VRARKITFESAACEGAYATAAASVLECTLGKAMEKKFMGIKPFPNRVLVIPSNGSVASNILVVFASYGLADVTGGNTEAGISSI
jgi:hypothetical protein